MKKRILAIISLLLTASMLFLAVGCEVNNEETTEVTDAEETETKKKNEKQTKKKTEKVTEILFKMPNMFIEN